MTESELSDEQLDRYARHIVLREIGGTGQKKLLAARICLVGAGAIGSAAIQYLAAAGVGSLIVIDDDVVSLSNLQRQTLYGSDEVGQRKVDCAAAAVARLNPDVRFLARAERIDAGNAQRLLAGADLVLDGSDNFATRLAVADAALEARIPLVSAAIAEFEGQLGVYRGWEPGLPCYRCLVGSDPALPERSCAEQGVLGALAGVMGSLAALEAIRLVTGFGDDISGRLLRFDALGFRMRIVTLPKDPGCPACSR
jgi:adenylyltransferase/sulfurtransferase